MDSKEYRIRGKEVVDYIADYLDSVKDRRVFPDKRPGFLRDQIPDSAPIEGEDWPKIFADMEKVIMPGVTHWQSPHMHAYFPALTSYPAMLGEMISNAIGCLGFTWASSPVCTELEIIVMNWLGKMIGLPETFMHKKNGKGGGVIQSTASEATLVSLLAGRMQTIAKYRKTYPQYEKKEVNCKLVAYASDQSHSSVLKASYIGLVDIKFVECDENLSMRGEQLLEAIRSDREAGLIPFWVCATLGTTGSCAFDNLEEISRICREESLWLHVDAAYAGCAFVCPEYRGWLKGIESVDSIAFNPSKWLLVHFDCTAMWVQNSHALHEAFNVNPLYLHHEFSGLAIDFTDWQIPLSRRFRALKLWFVIRNYGIKGLQSHIRKGVQLAEKFEAMVQADDRFEVVTKRHLGLIAFRLAGDGLYYPPGITESLLQTLNRRGKIHCVPANLKGKYVIRFTVTSPSTTEKDLLDDWTEIQTVASDLLDGLPKEISVEMRTTKVPLAETKKQDFFGTSLLLSNSPMSPKIVNGSFAAIYNTEVIAEFSRLKLREDAQNSPAMRRRIKGILMSGKQFSLDSRLDLFHGIEAQNNKPHDNNLPTLEDSNENDEDLGVSGSQPLFWEPSINVEGSANGEFLLEPSQRQTRSRSVDREVPILIREGNCATCKKCGHPVVKDKLCK